MANIQEVFTEFLVANFALCPKGRKQEENYEELVQELTIDFIRPHECTRRLDLLLQLKSDIIDKEPLNTAENVFFFLKVARIFNMIMQTSCPFLEEKIKKYNLKIATDYCDSHFESIQAQKSDILSLISSKINFDDDNVLSNGQSANETESILGRIEFLEWLLLNFSIWADATAYFNAAKFLKLACKFSGIEVDFIGHLGKRTKFQEKSLPQLILNPNQIKTAEWNYEFKSVTLPKNIENRDDTVLNKLALDDKVELESLDIGKIACVLATTWLKVREDSFLELRFEVIDALVNTLLEQEKIGFMMSISAFILRSEAERLNTRRVERACQQMEYLVGVLENIDNVSISNEEAVSRVQDLFLTSPIQPVWIIKKFYAKVLMSLALTNEAIGVFESICDWESVIEGYSILNMKDKALGILESLHEKQPDNPFYLCLIGEIRRDEALLQKVLKNTNDKYPKAHKTLGMMALNAKDYHKSFKHLKRVFELSPLSTQAVYNYGVSALEIGEIKDAITAFHHCVSIDPENYRAWNNLAASYVQSNQKARAVQVLKQGLKVHNESDRMWSNLFELAAELPSKKECLFALKRYLQFNPKQLDLKPVVKIILTNTEAANETFYPAPPLQNPLSTEELKLLIECLESAHQISTLDPMALRLMAHLQKPGESETDPKVFEHFIELMDLAENRELKNATVKPDYANVIKALLIIYEVRCRYAKLTGKETNALNKMIGYRIRPLFKKIDAEIGEKLVSKEEYGQLKEVVQEAKQLLAQI